jgi:hypothetical protein
VNVAQAMGFELQMIPLSEEEQEKAHCSQQKHIEGREAK